MVSDEDPMGKDIRRSDRIPYAGAIHISWEDQRRGAMFAMGRCIDVSPNGLRVELPHGIPIRQQVHLRAERINVSGSATVRHSRQHNDKYIIGLELSQQMLKK